MRSTRLSIDRSLVLGLLVASGLLAPACSSSPAPQREAQTAPVKPIAPPTLADDKPTDLPGLHNVVAYHEGYLSGSVPEGDEGFESLKAMGVKTIISVDGAAPEVERARVGGMRYIHLPIGYNGFDDARKMELVRATRDAMREGPVYIHCHHGKHRSAGAAAAVAASLGWMSPEEGVARMKVSGTAANYVGLYACAAMSAVVPTDAIDAVEPDFPEVARPKGIVRNMVETDQAFENLKLIEKAGWTTPKDHPDLVPVAEAGRLADLHRLLREEQRSREFGSNYLDLTERAQGQAQRLEDMLASPTRDAKALSAQFKLIAASCKDCHAKHRDEASYR